jgi:hypothetical protein
MARLLLDLQEMFIAVGAEPLVKASRVKYFRAGTLFLVADNTAIDA